MSQPILAVDVDGVISLFGFDDPPDRAEARFELIDGMVHCISLGRRGAVAAACGALRVGLGDGLGGPGERLPAQPARPAGAAAPHLRRRRAVRLGALEAGAAGRVRQGPGDGLGRRQLRRELLRVGAASGRSRPCSSPPRPISASRRPRPRRSQPGPAASSASTASAPDCSTLSPVVGFWPIFFLLVVLKIPVLASMWLVWWASKSPEEDPAEESGEGPGRRRPLAPRPRGPHHLPSGAGAMRRGRGAPGARGVPIFAPELPLASHNRRGENPSKRKGHPALSSAPSVKPAQPPVSARAGSHADKDGSPPGSCDV